MKLIEVRPAPREERGPRPLHPGMTAIISFTLLGGFAYLGAHQQKGAMRGLLFATLIPIVPPL